MTDKTYSGPDRRKLNGEHKAIAKSAAQEVLLGIGIDISTPERQVEHQKDTAHLRKHRLASDEIGKQTKRAAIGVLVTGVAGVVYMAFKNL